MVPTQPRGVFTECVTGCGPCLEARAGVVGAAHRLGLRVAQIGVAVKGAACGTCVEEAVAIGLHIQPAKSAAYSPEGDPGFFMEEMPGARGELDFINVLGVPVGKVEAVVAEMLKKAAMQKVTEAMGEIDEARRAEKHLPPQVSTADVIKKLRVITTVHESVPNGYMPLSSPPLIGSGWLVHWGSHIFLGSTRVLFEVAKSAFPLASALPDDFAGHLAYSPNHCPDVTVLDAEGPVGHSFGVEVYGGLGPALAFLKKTQRWFGGRRYMSEDEAKEEEGGEEEDEGAGLGKPVVWREKWVAEVQREGNQGRVGVAQVLRATLDVKEGVTLDMLDISGCKRLSWDAVRGALPNMGRVGRLRMRGGPLVTARSVAATHKLLAELGACTAAASLSLALRHDEGSLRHSVDQYLSAILSTAARDLKIEALELDLEDEETGTEGAMALAAALTPHEQDMLIWSLRTLNLAGNQLCGVDDDGDGTYDASGIEALADALAFNTSLNTLNLACNNLCGIRIIGLDEDEFNKIMMRDIKDGKVTELDLSGKGIGVPGARVLSKLLVFNTSLSTLDLGSNNLCGLDEDGEGTYDASGIKALAEALVFNGSLNTLTITDGVELPIGALRKNEITELDLSDKELRPEDAIILGAVLVSNKSLNTLDLSYNRLCGVDRFGDGTYDASGIKALADALAFNTSLNTLDLRRNNIGPEGAKALAVALTLNVEGVFNTSLNSITITDGVELPIGALRRNEITELDLSDKLLGPENAIILGAVLVFNGSLNTLVLRNNDIGPEGAKALAVALTPNAEGVFNTSLNTLNLRWNYIGDEGAKALAVALTPNAEGVFNTSLNTLDLRVNKIGPEGAKALAAALTPNEQGVFNTSLNTLELADNQLCGLDWLRRGTYDASGIKALADALVFNTSLNTLNLTSNAIRAEGAKALAVALTPNAEGVFNTSLNTLNLEHNDIGLEGAKALAVALSPNAEGVFNGSLNTLSLAGAFDNSPEGPLPPSPSSSDDEVEDS
ncbi:hypothetical protein CYMTET_16777 [Cymbomonas tetramitiformis]|uniref:Uncharacterized protein n=1 Tax=Cymbomonas tetramitiformis TaxID=36881 RepID=A0AAE0L7Z3_9CHLO|nr:hypothetical protein CYMTET_16777 [Cymbomonas tetramitiformis]